MAIAVAGREHEQSSWTPALDTPHSPAFSARGADRAPKGLSVGDRVSLSNGMGATVTAMGADGVTIDLNPELAGAPRYP